MSARKKLIKLTGLRRTIRHLMGIALNKLEEQMEELENGARLGRLLPEVRREWAAGVPALDSVVKEHNKKHPKRRVELPKAARR